MLNVARALLFKSGYALKFWSECVLTVVFLINRTSSSVLNGKTLFDLIIEKWPNYTVFRSFGCLAYVFVVHESDKFMLRVIECVFFSYAENKKTYKLLHLRTNKLFFFSRDVKFYENVFPFTFKKIVETKNDKLFTKSFHFMILI